MSGIAEIQGGARTCAEVLSEVGALAIPRALDTRICAGLIREMKSSPATPTRPISPETMEREHFPDFVRSKTGEGSPFARAIVELALARHLPRLRAHFQRPLEWNTELHFLTYEKGDFIGPHCDVMDGDAVLEDPRADLVVQLVSQRLRRARRSRFRGRCVRASPGSRSPPRDHVRGGHPARLPRGPRALGARGDGRNAALGRRVVPDTASRRLSARRRERGQPARPVTRPELRFAGDGGVREMRFRVPVEGSLLPRMRRAARFPGRRVQAVAPGGHVAVL